jgi:CRISPR/Cas system-associated exonuclease Cas4 (RecB family)
MNESKIVWSYSGAKMFENCPRQYHAVKVEKRFQSKDTDATRFGKSVHKALEDYVRDGTPVPAEYTKYLKYADMLAGIKGERYLEHEMGFTEDLKPCEFHGNGVWWHGIPDVLIVGNKVAHIIDYKTGKSSRYADTGQLELLSVAAMLHHPNIQTVRGALLFLVADDMVTKEYTRAQIPEIMAKWYGKINQIEAAMNSGVWNPKAGPLCKFCAVEDCEYR